MCLFLFLSFNLIDANYIVHAEHSNLSRNVILQEDGQDHMDLTCEQQRSLKENRNEKEHLFNT